ncbi:hypothetical protein BM1_01071 [Bipolaris maydis]|nr:hypothetical protein BM1_01071 [Bipolaris maydis]
MTLTDLKHTSMRRDGGGSPTQSRHKVKNQTPRSGVGGDRGSVQQYNGKIGNAMTDSANSAVPCRAVGSTGQIELGGPVAYRRTSAAAVPHSASLLGPSPVPLPTPVLAADSPSYALTIIRY